MELKGGAAVLLIAGLIGGGADLGLLSVADDLDALRGDAKLDKRVACRLRPLFA